jgi:DNA-directed RNA polymerase specialized sigma24 family protein
VPSDGTAAAAPRALPCASGYGSAGPAQQVALVARAKREVLLRAHRHRLRAEELEDCYSQATLELLAAVRAGRRFAGRAHLVNALELRFESRIRDRRRALRGRSPLQAALESALPLGGPGELETQIRDVRADVHRLVAQRTDLQQLLAAATGLSADQRLVIACQVAGIERAEFCRRFGWSFEKYRKVAQRARARLRALMQLERPAPAPAPAPASLSTPKPTAMSAPTPVSPASAAGVSHPLGCGRDRGIGTHL